MPQIPQSTLDEIKSRVDMVALVSEHVALKRSGRGYAGLCPFHKESSPSFYVNPERGSFHCFDCKVGGNAFTFLTRMTGCTFPDAVRLLAKKVGVEVPEGRAAVSRDRLLELKELAAELFRVVLLESRHGAGARAYLESRGINDETAERFRIGFAPGEIWVRKLLGRGFTRRELLRAGLTVEGRSGPYPLFRARLMFPVGDLNGRVIGFGARRVSDSEAPRYIHSPTSKSYRKGAHLFGMHLARSAARARSQVLLVPAYCDVVTLWQAGVCHSVATMDSGVSMDQLSLASRFAGEVVLVLEENDAGRRVALRTFEVCLDDPTIWPKVLFLPRGDEEDGLCGKVGCAHQLTAEARPLVDFFLSDLVGENPAPGDIARAASALSRILARAENPIVREVLVAAAAKMIDVSPDALLSAARRAFLEERSNAGRAESESS